MEADNHAPGALQFEAPSVGLRDDLVRDDVEHSASGKGQTPGQQRSHQCDGQHADEASAEKWHDAFEHAVSRAASLADLALRRGAAIEVKVRGASSPVVMPGSPPDPIWRFLALLETVAASEAPPLPESGEHSLIVEVAA